MTKDNKDFVIDDLCAWIGELKGRIAELEKENAQLKGHIDGLEYALGVRGQSDD